MPVKKSQVLQHIRICGVALLQRNRLPLFPLGSGRLGQRIYLCPPHQLQIGLFIADPFKSCISWKRFAFQHKNHKGRQRIGLRKDGQGNLLHPRSHPRCNQAAPCVCASVQPPHQTGQRCGSIGCSFFTSFKRKGPAPHGVEPFSKLFNYFKILRGSGLFIQHALSINRLLFQAFHLLAL